MTVNLTLACSAYDRTIALAVGNPLGLEATVPGYIGRVWNLPALSGLSLAGLPIEELLFAAAFGSYWSAVYEHLAWSTSATSASLAGTLTGSVVSPRTTTRDTLGDRLP